MQVGALLSSIVVLRLLKESSDLTLVHGSSRSVNSIRLDDDIGWVHFPVFVLQGGISVGCAAECSCYCFAGLKS